VPAAGARIPGIGGDQHGAVFDHDDVVRFGHLRTALQFTMFNARTNVRADYGAGAFVGKSSSRELSRRTDYRRKRVLLIDADSAQRDLHQYFGLSSAGVAVGVLANAAMEAGTASCGGPIWIHRRRTAAQSGRNYC